MQRVLVISLVHAVVLYALDARAQTTPGTTSADGADPARGQTQMRDEVLADEAARSHFRVGQLLYAEGRFADAGAEFQAAYTLSNRPALLYNAYVAYRDANDLEHAIVVLDEYLRRVPDGEDSQVLARRLATMRTALESRMSEQQEIDSERRRLEDERARLAHEAEAERQRAEAAERQVARQHSPVPWVVGGSGLALLAGAGVAAILANNAISDADAKCPDHVCPRSSNLDSIRASIRRPAIATDVMLAAGGATLVTGVILLIVQRSHGDAPPVSASCTRTGCSGSFSLRF